MYLILAIELRMVKYRGTHFSCPHCRALYHVVKTEARSETTKSELICVSCGGPLRTREGNSILRYFLLRNAARRQTWRRK
jgi:transcription elongation factor Elf1